MILLQSLSISGFKSIKETEVPLTFGNVTILVGANGSGKSNLLSFFGMLNFLTNESLQSYIGRNGGPDRLLHYGLKRTKEIHAKLEFGTEQGSNTYEMTLTWARGRSETLIFNQESVNYCENGKPTRSPFEMGFGHAESALLDPRNESNQTVAFFLRALKGFRFYQFHDTSPEGPLRRDRCEIWNYRPFHGDGGNLPAVLFRLKSVSPENWHLLIRTIRLVAPFFRDFVFQKESGRSSEGDVLLSWVAEGQDYAFGMHQLSDGTLRFVALATLLLLPEGMSPEGAILIDEPELGLHPRALGVLAGLIQSASERVQIICTTQSPDLLSEFEPSAIRVVDREAGATVFRAVDAAKLESWLEDDFSLGEIWKKNLIGGRPHHE